MHLAHNEHDLHEITRRCHAIRMNGIDSELLTPQQIKQRVPMINLNARFPVLGALYQGRAGTARHDAVAWGYARGADALGVDIIQNCEVLGFEIQNNEVKGVHTSQGLIRADKVGCVAAGNSSVLAAQAGLKLPLESATLQAFVSEPLKPMLDSVVTSNTVHCYVSQSDKGELVIGGSSDPYNSYSQRGGFDQIEHVVGPMAELYPIISRLKMMRQWGGTVDLAPDRSLFSGNPPWAICTSTVAGAPAALKLRPAPETCSPIRWPTAGCTRSLNRSGWNVLPAANLSTKARPPALPTN